MNFKRTKLITSLGPVSESQENIEKLLINGADIARLNFSHGNGEEHYIKVKNVRAVAAKLGKPMSLLLDTKGPEIRTHLFEGGEATIEADSTVEIYLQEKILGDKNKFSISYPNLHNDVQVGGKILIDDGYLELDIIEISKEKIITKAENTHTVADRRGVNVPGGIISIDFLSDKDIADIEFGCDHDFDYIALSFVQKAEDVNKVREILKRKNKEHIQLISKLESQGAVDNFREILEASDAIMVARGDLGVEIDPTQVPALQKKWVREANKIGKPVIVATQMLESMTKNPRPTRAEVSDVYNAIEDATSAIMLSGESAKGKYFMEAAKYMNNISLSSEDHFDGQRYFNRINRDGSVTEFDGVAKKAFQLTFASNVHYIFLLNPTKELISIVSRIKPYAKIVPVFTDAQQLTRWNLYYGVYPTLTTNELSISSLNDVKAFAKNYGLKENDRVIIIDGLNIEEVTL